MGKIHANGPAHETAHNSHDTGEMVEVLYQKMGDRWFAFSMIGDDVFVGSLTQDEVEGKTPADSITGKKIGNS